MRRVTGAHGALSFVVPALYSETQRVMYRLPMLRREWLFLPQNAVGSPCHPLVIVCSHTAGGCVLDSGRGHQRNHAPGLLHVGSDEDLLNLPHCSVVLFSRSWECACAMEQDDRSVSTDDVGDRGYCRCRQMLCASFAFRVFVAELNLC